MLESFTMQNIHLSYEFYVARPMGLFENSFTSDYIKFIAQNAIVFWDMYLQCPARNNNG